MKIKLDYETMWRTWNRWKEAFPDDFVHHKFFAYTSRRDGATYLIGGRIGKQPSPDYICDITTDTIHKVEGFTSTGDYIVEGRNIDPFYTGTVDSTWLTIYIDEMEQRETKRVNNNEPRCPICGRQLGYFRLAPACKICNIFQNVDGDGSWLRISTLEKVEFEDIPF